MIFFVVSVILPSLFCFSSNPVPLTVVGVETAKTVGGGVAFGSGGKPFLRWVLG